MKIAVILPSLANRGPILVAKDIIDNIFDKVELIHIYYFDEIVELSFPCKCFKISFWGSIHFDKYDIIHTHMLRPDIFVWKNKSKIKNAKCITTLHQDIRQNLNYNYNVVISYLFEKIWLITLTDHDIVVTLSETMKKQYSQNIKNKNIHRIYNGRNIEYTLGADINENDEQQILNLKNKYKIIGSSALLTKRKGLHQVIQALPNLKSFALIIIGDGKEKKKLIKLSKKYGVSEKCLFLGYRNDASQYLKYFDIYSAPSISEGFHLGLLEAGLNRLPVVCSDIDIFKELYSKEEVSFFKLGDINSLINAFNYAYDNRTQLSNNIFNTINEKYSVKIMANNYLKLYSECIH